MKIWNEIILASLFGATLSIVACGGGSNGGGGSAPADPNASAFATTPQPCNASAQTASTNPYCLQQNPQQGYGYGYGSYGYGYQYQQAVLPGSWPYGAWQFPTQWQPQQGSCGCPSGYQTVYHQSYGIACAPQAYFGNNNSYGGASGGAGFGFGGVFFGVSFNWGSSYGPAVNNQNLNIPQTYYQQGGSCAGSAAPVQGCDTRTVNTCGSGRICQPVGAGSSIGVCVSNYYQYNH